MVTPKYWEISPYGCRFAHHKVYWVRTQKSEVKMWRLKEKVNVLLDQMQPKSSVTRRD